MKKIGFSLILAVLLTACAQSSSTNSIATQTPFVITEIVAHDVVVTATPVNTALPSPTMTAVVKPPAVPTSPISLDMGPVSGCSLTDGTAQVQITKTGNEWILDPANLKVVDGYSNTTPGHDVSQLLGCDIWVEFESPMAKEHILVVLRDNPALPISFLDEDGKFHIPQPKGGSAWVGPANWNTADFSAQKPPLVYEMAAERNVNQLTNAAGSYDWPEIINLPDGRIVVYEIGYHYGQYYTGCDDLDVPEPIYIAGTILGSAFNASIGMAGCYVAVKIDGTWTYWQNAKDNVLYTTAEAVLFPKSASETDVQAWIAEQK